MQVKPLYNFSNKIRAVKARSEFLALLIAMSYQRSPKACPTAGCLPSLWSRQPYSLKQESGQHTAIRFPLDHNTAGCDESE